MDAERCGACGAQVNPARLRCPKCRGMVSTGRELDQRRREDLGAYVGVVEEKLKAAGGYYRFEFDTLASKVLKPDAKLRRFLFE